ncbi:hypothetical protein [Pseudoalteromonas luteoviolacea]|uniref:Uncharacterized protein n=1 Tax=Pseudoalteromonas luteoviolacea S4054 TaxID=1129367 RepID=A0A0F6AIR4_9GAMM|nr:hypothetical protein [Pseudoalteromonas luteoviolacea]AOT08710.1 hypothetical protein S4054249_12985 [Pseudoalteromonas luteoviolacea]AOT13625.1 hypothetical protein S40542_12960 [Pseudoalteromonas luteoviolacea]AOT18538.1 hypothetical protein S4054_12960 [Pseudoalteromonas luteoviolacea]KKE85604.1 hypothetical protein N479_25655 [Pseudoalteromonas luteoviolacea S4054]KZN71986.1 hypothetical protein N481_16375 [Pseudoalteromonas luteoviolacea S4047-1]
MDSFQRILVWISELGLTAKLIASLMIVSMTALFLLQIWQPDFAQGEQGKVVIERQKARFGVSLGLQLGRYDLIQGSKFPEAQEAESEIVKQIEALLKQDGYKGSINDVTSRELIAKLLTHYSVIDVEKHAAILIGISALRASLVGVSTVLSNNMEMKELSLSALQDIDSSVVKNKMDLFEKLLSSKPKSTTEVVDLIMDF